MSILTNLVLPALRLGGEGGHEGGFNPLTEQWGVLFWTWLIFLVSLPFMWKVVFGPIAKALKDRDQRAEDAIARAEEAKAAAERARSETEARLEEAREEARRQIQAARERAEAQHQELLAKAKEEAARERDRAADEIRAEKQRALAEIRDEVVDLTLTASAKLLGREIRDEDQKSFVQGFVREAERFPAGKD